MKRIDNTDVWTDGVVKYKKNEMGELVVYVERTVELEEEVVLKPIDTSEDS